VLAIPPVAAAAAGAAPAEVAVNLSADPVAAGTRISTDGGYAYFQSAATNLTADRWARQPSVFLRDMAAGTVKRLDIPG
jgi:hypothetical protein